jgi:hypothetical protein
VIYPFSSTPLFLRINSYLIDFSSCKSGRVEAIWLTATLRTDTMTGEQSRNAKLLDNRNATTETFPRKYRQHNHRSVSPKTHIYIYVTHHKSNDHQLMIFRLGMCLHYTILVLNGSSLKCSCVLDQLSGSTSGELSDSEISEISLSKLARSI